MGSIINKNEKTKQNLLQKLLFTYHFGYLVKCFKSQRYVSPTRNLEELAMILPHTSCCVWLPAGHAPAYIREVETVT